MRLILPLVISLGMVSSFAAGLASRAFAADILEMPSTNAHAGCALGDATEDAQGRRQLCCAPDTTDAYFADPSTLEAAGDCGGHWASTAAACDIDGASGITWTCSVPRGPVDGLSPSAELDAADAADAADPTGAIEILLDRGHHHASHAHGGRHLASTATRLARLGKKQYNAVQRRWVGTTFPACNYFVISALCENGECHGHVPMVQASAFGTYLRGHGWHEVSLSELKAMFRRGENFDAIMSRVGGRHGHGHVLIPTGAQRTGFTVAEGSLGTLTHGIRTLPDSYLAGRFHAYVRH